MDGSAAKAMPSEEVLFHDGLGDRILARDNNRKPVHESLLLRAELSGVPPFEFSLTQRVGELQSFDHPSFVRVQRLVRIPGRLPRLSVVSAHAGGVRLSELLAAAEPVPALRAPASILFIVRELLEGLAALHQQGADISHGALAPERIVIAGGSVRIVDYVLGSAIEQLRFSSERYWQELRVAVPPSTGASKIDRRADVAQVGMVAAALFAGRPLRVTEHIANLDDVLAGIPVTQPLRNWLLRALHLDPQRSFASAVDARRGLEQAMGEARMGAIPLSSEVGKVRPSYGVPVTIRPATSPKLPSPVVPAGQIPPTRGTMFQGVRRGAEVMYSGDVQSRHARPRTFTKRLKTLVMLGVLGASITGAFTAAQFLPPPAVVFAESGTLTIDSNPRGAQLLIDHKNHGVTPATVKLKGGRHDIELHGFGENRVFSVYLPGGANVSQYVELVPPAPRARNQKPM